MLRQSRHDSGIRTTLLTRLARADVAANAG